MRNFLGFLLLFLATIIQISFLPHLTVLNLVPNIVLIMIICWSLTRPPDQSIIWALMGGILLDVFSSSPFGIFTLLFVLISFAISFAKTNLIGDINLTLKIFVGATGILTFNLLYLLTNKLFALTNYDIVSINTIDYLIKITPMEFVYSLIILIILLKPIQKLSDWLSYYEYTSKVPTRVK